MDTRWKNIKYSIGAKIIAVILLWLSLIGAAGSGIFFIYYYDELTSETYFDMNDFKWDYARLVHNVVELNIKLISEESIKASEMDTGNIEESLSGKLERLHIIKRNLSKTVNFVYYIKNSQTNEIITNLEKQDPLNLIQKQSAVEYFNQWETNPYFPMSENITKMLSNTPYEIYTAIMNPLQPGDSFYDDYMVYSKIKTMSQYILITFITCLAIMVISFIYLVYVSGRREKHGQIYLTFVDQIHTDVHTFLVFCVAALSSSVIISIDSNIPLWINYEILIFLIIFGLDMIIGLSYIFSMIRQIKNKQIIKNSLFYKISKASRNIIKICFSGKLFKPWILIFLSAYGAINAISFMIVIRSDSFFLFFMYLIFNALVIFYVAKSLLSLTRIMEAVKEISTGNLDYSLPTNKISPVFLHFSENIQSIQTGLKKAVSEAVKGERMKTDLITNVSHDLKTPLTSIITYVDLLKKENLNNQNAEEYVRILEEKSSRLKHLIDDLIEASKASSGNLMVQTDKVDLFELIQQAQGEFEEKILISQLDLRIHTDEPKIFIQADGKYMWRIIENLLSNVVKYSLENSRVYIDLSKSNTHGILTIKNISSFPLEISPEQLIERFVRGDTSRTTEGSGLGLSIAQSLTALQGGKFDIQIDGDLFKTIITMPLWAD